MTTPIIFSTHSRHKLQEVKQLFGDEFTFLTLADMEFNEDIPEPFFTLEENAAVKAETVYQRFQFPTFAEDTGLFIEALNGEPGVFSARYAGEPTDARRNIEKVLEQMEGLTSRKAYFKTVICFKTDTQRYFFEGVCEGSLSEHPQGEKGFGYDPIFIPDGYSKTFAELGDEAKNKISHRKKAMDAFKHFLSSDPAWSTKEKIS